ncbi:Bud-site selection protein [Lojkania enalia]|uniref:Bud-site selection protein n=1 Tax=Lojkania enalia TaxID=147567 RepID=A0A9P4NAQ2_9PLEO|nr:Bud-site selection protein [Didymosphaeria enalia]
MPKRKRFDLADTTSDNECPSNRFLGRQRKLCTARLETGKKALTSALRLVAGFERQKHSRRRKTAQANNDAKALARLEAEYVVLKGLDFANVAEQHLRKTIGKVKSLRETEGVPKQWKVVEKEKVRPEVLNVQARLFKGRGVKECVDEVVDDLKRIVGSGEAARKNKKFKGNEKAIIKERMENASEDEDNKVESEFNEDVFAAFDARIAAPSSAEENEDDSLSEGRRPPSISDSDRDKSEETAEETAEETEASEPRRRPGFIEIDSEVDMEDSEVSKHTGSLTSKDEDEDEEEEREEGEEDDDDDNVLILPSKAKAKSKHAEKTSKSTFLPSLSMAAYYSDPESEASDLDIDIKPKKNRRGQRARQKIWEQKFGDKAKHVQNQERDKGWDPKKGAVDTSRKGHGGKPIGRGRERSGENATPLGTRRMKRDDVGTLHPSWVAAKAAKEKKIDMKPQGTKLVFD